jgi:hypothetical protein
MVYNFFVKLKSDKYRKDRGGYSRVLELSCASCSNRICYYQKDGPGILKRTYLDRMIGYDGAREKIICSSCNALIGNYYIYEKENRPAFAIIPGTVSKKIVKSANLDNLL